MSGAWNRDAPRFLESLGKATWTRLVHAGDVGQAPQGLRADRQKLGQTGRFALLQDRLNSSLRPRRRRRLPRPLSPGWSGPSVTRPSGRVPHQAPLSADLPRRSLRLGRTVLRSRRQGPIRQASLARLQVNLRPQARCPARDRRSARAPARRAAGAPAPRRVLRDMARTSSAFATHQRDGRRTGLCRPARRD